MPRVVCFDIIDHDISFPDIALCKIGAKATELQGMFDIGCTEVRLSKDALQGGHYNILLKIFKGSDFQSHIFKKIYWQKSFQIVVLFS